MTQKTIKSFLFIIVIVIYLTLIIKYLDPILSAATLHTKSIFYAILLTILGISMQVFNYLGLLSAKNNLKLIPTIRVWAISGLVNYIAPFQPGLLIRAKYLNTMGVSYTESTATVIKQLHYSCWVGLGIFSATLPVTDSKTYVIKIVATITFLSWLIFLLPIKSILNKYSSNPYIQHAVNSLKYPTFKQLSLFISHYLIVSTLFYVVLNEFDIPASFIYSMFLSSVIVVASLTSITPNNLGIQEMIIGYFIFKLGTSNYEHITLPFVIRLAHILACSIIVFLSSVILAKKSNTN